MLRSSARVGSATTDERRLAGLDQARLRGDAFALLGGLAEDLAIDRTGEVVGEEPGVVHLDRVDDVDLHLEYGLLTRPKVGGGILGGDDDEIEGAVP